MTQRESLSVVLIALNAATQLEPCLHSVAFADEIVLVDSGSADGTAELAARYGARVLQQEWLGFGRQKQFAVEQAGHDWVLCLDADERVTPALRASIENALLKPAFGAYRFARCNRFLGRYLRHGEGYPDLNLRLFHRRRARWSDDVVHEHVLAQCEVGTLGGDLLHDSAETIAAYLNKQNRYTSLAAGAAFAAGRRASAANLLLSPILRFIKFYVLRRGFLDGLPGFVHIVIGSFNSFSKYAKMNELQIKQREGLLP
ncbi:glycosyltransferase family 2 protein [Propionivibrio sp.]|uniref:glycosyltransferase family 2 protein n=1 Tax=Propionivibrio sp. TaxID=2212460 RepID=UPI003BF27955